LVPAPNKPTVVLADDHPANLQRVSQILDNEFEVVARVHDGFEALNSARQLEPDILILDFSMPGMNGIQVARDLRKHGYRSAILFLTIQADDDYMEVLQEIGAGFVSKLRMQKELIPAIRAELRKGC
jgi:DNA-binding NarL/FixJ family response regulator